MRLVPSSRPTGTPTSTTAASPMAHDPMVEPSASQTSGCCTSATKAQAMVDGGGRDRLGSTPPRTRSSQTPSSASTTRAGSPELGHHDRRTAESGRPRPRVAGRADRRAGASGGATVDLHALTGTIGGYYRLHNAGAKGCLALRPL